jgi:cephalosporin hydroxylase
MSEIRLRLVGLADKIQARSPAPLRGLGFWPRLKDHLRSGHYLAPARRAALEAACRACRSPEELYDFAGTVLPSHQNRGEILGFLRLARSLAPKTVMEIGTASGGTNFLLGAALADSTLKIGVDLHVQNTRLLRAFGRPECRQVFLNGSSYAPAMVERVKTVLAGRLIDVLFIDGDHSYEGVKADYEAYAPWVRPGGLIAFHDIEADYLTRFGRATGRYAGDVPRYWQDVRGAFAETWEFVDARGQDGLGIGVGRVK